MTLGKCQCSVCSSGNVCIGSIAPPTCKDISFRRGHPHIICSRHFLICGFCRNYVGIHSIATLRRIHRHKCHIMYVAINTNVGNRQRVDSIGIRCFIISAIILTRNIGATLARFHRNGDAYTRFQHASIATASSGNCTRDRAS